MLRNRVKCVLDNLLTTEDIVDHIVHILIAGKYWFFYIGGESGVWVEGKNGNKFFPFFLPSYFFFNC